MNLCVIAIISNMGFLRYGKIAILVQNVDYRMMWYRRIEERWRLKISSGEKIWLQNGFTVEVPLDFDFSVEASLAGHYSFAAIDRKLVEHLPLVYYT